MSFRRWRLATLMGLVGLVALGIKGALLFLPKHDIVRDHIALGGLPHPLPQSPAIEAELVGLLDDSQTQIRLRALGWLDRIGSTDPTMIPLLVDELMFKRYDYQFGKYWPTGRDIRFDPADALKRIKPPAAQLAALLRPALNGSIAESNRRRAIDVLADAAGRAGSPPDPTLVALLLGVLDDHEAGNRLRAGEGLALLVGAARRPVVRKLIEQLIGPDRPAALVAAAILARFGPEGSEAALALARKLDANADDPATRVEDLYLLGRIGSPARSAAPAIARAMTAPDAREVTGLPLQRFESESNPRYILVSSGALIVGDIGTTDLGRAGSMGTYSLGRIGPDAGFEAVATLTGMLRDGEESRRLAAAAALGDLGLQAEAAFGEMLALVDRTTANPGAKDWYKTQDWFKIQRLIGTLAKVTRGDEPRLAAALIRLLGSADEAKRAGAASALARPVLPGPAAIPALLDAARDAMPGVRWYAAVALGRCVDREGRVVPTLLGLLDDPHRGVRLNAAESLAQIGAGTDRAVPVVAEILRSTDHVDRWRAAEVLGKLGHAARPAVPALLAARSDPEGAVRERVDQALKRIDPSVSAEAGSAHSLEP